MQNAKIKDPRNRLSNETNYGINILIQPWKGYQNFAFWILNFDFLLDTSRAPTEYIGARLLLQLGCELNLGQW